LADIAKISKIDNTYSKRYNEPNQEECVSKQYISPFPTTGWVAILNGVLIEYRN